MRIIDANTLSDFARKSAESASDFASVVRNLILDVRDSYRPEVHYMRGPGPKWHAKHQPWLRFESEAVPPGGQHELSPVHVRPRDSANVTFLANVGGSQSIFEVPTACALDADARTKGRPGEIIGQSESLNRCCPNGK